MANSNFRGIIRPANPSDASAIAAIFNQYLAKATMVIQARHAGHYLPLLNGERTKIYVAADDNRVMGFAGVKPYSDRGGYWLAGEVSVFLDGNATGKSIGDLLYAKIIPLADEIGYRHLTAKIWANNPASIRLHEKHGFRMVGEQKGIGWINGKRIDTVIMEKSW